LSSGSAAVTRSVNNLAVAALLSLALALTALHSDVFVASSSYAVNCFDACVASLPSEYQQLNANAAVSAAA